MAEGLNNYLRTGKKKIFNHGVRILIGVLSISIVVLVLMQLGWFKEKLYTHDAKALLAVTALLSFIIMLVFSLYENDNRKKMYKYALAPLLFLFCAHFLIPNKVISRKAPGSFIKHEIANINARSIIVSDGSLIRAVCWFFKRADIYQLEAGGELMYGLKREGGCRRLLDFAHFRELIDKYSGKRQIVLFAKSRTYECWKPSLPEPLIEKRNNGNNFVSVLF